MKKHILEVFSAVLFLFVVIGTLSGCGSQTTNTTTRDIQNEYVSDGQIDRMMQTAVEGNERKPLEYDQEAVTHADLIMSYDTIDTLKNEATVVLEGNVIRTSVYLHKVNDDVVPYTLIELEVTNVLKGNIDKNTNILVAEYGGIITAEQAGLRSKFPDMTDEDANEKFLMSFGNKLAEEGQRLLLFLSNDDGHQILNVETPYYMIVGEYYGMFIHDASTFYVQNTPSYAEDSERIVIEDTVFSNW